MRYMLETGLRLLELCERVEVVEKTFRSCKNHSYELGTVEVYRLRLERPLV